MYLSDNIFLIIKHPSSLQLINTEEKDKIYRKVTMKVSIIQDFNNCSKTFSGSLH